MAAKHLGTSSSAPVVGRKRVLFLDRTSEIVGSFTKTDLESYANLIRRKVQERCATTQELMQTIRRIKTGEAGYVTPNEFRFTLIKLGITLPQKIVNNLFNMFDSDGSGTMDFDEFATWIMNSEFRPDNSAGPPKEKRAEPVDAVLRRKFLALKEEWPGFFDTGRESFSFIELVSEITRKGIKSVNERDVRTLFLLFDTEKSNFVKIKRVSRWVETGSLVPPPQTPKAFIIPDLNTALRKIVGTTPEILIRAFQYAKGQRNVHFDEFRRTILSAGLAARTEDLRELFLAVGGNSGAADIDGLLIAAAALPFHSEPAHAGMKSIASFAVPSRADRKLRQAIRKTYATIAECLERADPGGSGYVDGDLLRNLLVRHCMPLTYEDFRYIVSRIETDPKNVNRYNWHHFLQVYNPLDAPHELDGGATSPAKRLSSTFMLRQSSPLHHPQPVEPSPVVVPSGGSASELNAVKKVWILVLRSCQRADPNKTGYINRNQFIAALQKTLHESLSSDTMSKLADTYTRRDGLVDYKSCFRNTLSDLANQLPVFDSASVFKAAEKTLAKPAGPTHPWDFDYVKQPIVNRDDPVVPHWQTACLKPKPRPQTTSAAGASMRALTLSPVKKLPKDCRGDEAEQFLAKYHPSVRPTCTKLIMETWKPIWKQLLALMHDRQIQNHPGNITTDNMTGCLKDLGVGISKSTYSVIFRYFGAVGKKDVFNFAEFVDVCTVCKNIEKAKMSTFAPDETR